MLLITQEHDTLADHGKCGVYLVVQAESCILTIMCDFLRKLGLSGWVIIPTQLCSSLAKVVPKLGSMC